MAFLILKRFWKSWNIFYFWGNIWPTLSEFQKISRVKIEKYLELASRDVALIYNPLHSFEKATLRKSMRLRKILKP